HLINPHNCRLRSASRDLLKYKHTFVAVKVSCLANYGLSCIDFCLMQDRIRREPSRSLRGAMRTLLSALKNEIWTRGPMRKKGATNGYPRRVTRRWATSERVQGFR